jgi:hypothetical protein
MDKELSKEQYTETLNLIRAEVDQQIKPLSNQLKDFTDRQNEFNTKVMDAGWVLCDFIRHYYGKVILIESF